VGHGLNGREKASSFCHRHVAAAAWVGKCEAWAIVMVAPWWSLVGFRITDGTKVASFPVCDRTKIVPSSAGLRDWVSPLRRRLL
jgi:hypothetical protein